MSLCRHAIAAFVLVVFCLFVPLQAQSGISHFVPMLGQLGDSDDVVVLPNGELLIARPQTQSIGYFHPGASPDYTPLPLPPVICSALELAPDGNLFYGDSLSGTVKELDLATMQQSTIVSGLNIPIDVVLDNSGHLYICDLLNSDFFFGPCSIRKINLHQQTILGTVPVLTVSGAADVEVGSFGELFIASLGSPEVKVLLPQTTVPIPIASNVFLPTDLVVIDNGQQLVVSCLYQGKVLTIDLATGVKVDLVSGLGANQQGAEDIAVRANGNLLITVNSGEVYEMDLSSKLYQVGNANIGHLFGVTLNMPDHMNEHYSILMSLSATTGSLIGGLPFPLDVDPFLMATTVNRPPHTMGFDGVLGNDGRAYGLCYVPNLPELIGFDLYMAAVTFDANEPLVTGCSNGMRVVIEP